jgi:hypothetical protein
MTFGMFLRALCRWSLVLCSTLQVCRRRRSSLRRSRILREKLWEILRAGARVSNFEKRAASENRRQRSCSQNSTRGTQTGHSGIHGYRYCQRFDDVLELLFTSHVHIEPLRAKESHVIRGDAGSRYFQEP